MTSSLQSAVTTIQRGNYMTHMLLDLGAACLSILLPILVVTLTAVGYDMVGNTCLCVPLLNI